MISLDGVSWGMLAMFTGQNYLLKTSVGLGIAQFVFCFSIRHLLSANCHFAVAGKTEYIPIKVMCAQLSDVLSSHTVFFFLLFWDTGATADPNQALSRFRKTNWIPWLKFTAGIATFAFSRKKMEVLHESDLVFQLPNRQSVLKSLIILFYISTSVLWDCVHATVHSFFS